MSKYVASEQACDFLQRSHALLTLLRRIKHKISHFYNAAEVGEDVQGHRSRSVNVVDENFLPLLVKSIFGFDYHTVWNKAISVLNLKMGEEISHVL